MSLIDVTAEDDLLIDSKIDRASLDLRLSISYDVNEHLKDKVKSRPSLAWDNAFFTSAGILDLRELSLVNEGFNNPEDQTRICDKRRLTCKLPRGGGGGAQESFLDFRVKHNTREPKININSSAPQTRMKHVQVHPQTKLNNQEIRKSTEMSSAQKQDRHMKPPRVQTRASVNLPSAAKSPKSAFSKNNVSSSAGKRWLSKSLDFKGENGKKIGGGLDVNGVDSTHKSVTIDCNVAQVPENSKYSSSNKVQIGAKAKRSLSPLHGDVMNSSKKHSRLCMQSQRTGLFDDNCPTQSPVSRGKDCKANGELKRGQQKKTNSHSETKMTRSVYKDDEKENKFHVECERFHGGLAKEKYVEITSLFEGLVIEPKEVNPNKTSVSRLVSSAPTLRPKTKQSSRAMKNR